jgi:WD40 repeat protein
MKAIIKYLLFVCFLMAVVYMAANPDLPLAYPFSGSARMGHNPAGTIPSLTLSRSQGLAGLRSTGAIDYSTGKNLTATGEEGSIKLWQLPDEKPVLEIRAGEGFQVLQVRFQPGKGVIAGCGLTAEGKGAVRLFDLASGKQVLQMENTEPVITMDFDRSGRYLILTGMSQIKVWDGVENQAVSIFPRDSAESHGVFFMEDRFVLQTDTLSLYDWKNRKKGVGPESPGAPPGPIKAKKIHDNLCAWVSREGLQTWHSPEGKREFIPFNTQGIYAFDLAPDGKWGLFLKENKTMAVIDCATGLTVKTLGLKLRPDTVFIDGNGANAYVVYGSGNIDVYDVGNENIFKNAKFYTTRFLSRLWNNVGGAAKGV